jgi:PAS domain S-box-containing protein
MQKANILFICIENSARSQIAEGFARDIAPPDVGIFSAGTQPAQALHPMAVEVMNDFGIDISQQAPKHIDEVIGPYFTIAVTLCRESEVECPVLAGAPANVHWSLDDPASLVGSREEIRDDFFMTAKKIQQLVSDLFNRGYLNAFFHQKKNMENVINSLSEAVIANGSDRKITFFSRGAEKLTGISSGDAIGKDCHDILGSPLCGPNCSLCEGYDLSNVKERSYVTVFNNADGLRKECQVALLPMADGVGNIIGSVAAFTDRSKIKRLQRKLKEEKGFKGIVGQDRRMLDIFKQIRDVSPHDYPVHISGETGTGKELVALAIHQESPRSSAPFVPVNCGALPESIVESELFGHVKGSFTGAVRDKKGRFELAEGGTIFLDEIGDLPKSTQVKILRVLQEGTFERVGAEKTTSVDVRVISATNKDLRQEVKRGRFRDDLFYRLNVIPLDLPPLRKRLNDIPLLVEHFLNKAAEENNSKPVEISGETMSILLDYTWSGNVRELQNVIQFAIVKSRGDIITPDCLPLELQKAMERIARPGPSRKLRINSVVAALQESGGNKTGAANILGVGRATLYRFLSSHPEILDERME